MNIKRGGSQDRTGRLSGLDALSTFFLCIFLLVISWFLSKWFEAIRADESLVFGTLGFLGLLILIFVFLQWRWYGSIWIPVLQGFILSAFAAFPIFRREPSIEPITGPLVVGIFGAFLSTAIIIISRFVTRRTHQRAAPSDANKFGHTEPYTKEFKLFRWLFPSFGLVAIFVSFVVLGEGSRYREIRALQIANVTFWVVLVGYLLGLGIDTLINRAKEEKKRKKSNSAIR